MAKNSSDFINEFIKAKPFLFHITRIENLPNIIKLNALLSVNEAQKHIVQNTYTSNQIVTKRYSNNNPKVIINKNNVISEFIPNNQINLNLYLFNSTQDRDDFYSFLDNHVFLWADVKFRDNMLKSYGVHDMVILKLNTSKLFSNIKFQILFSKYNSGSNPRSHYIKSNQLFISRNSYLNNIPFNNFMPQKPSHVREVLISDEIPDLEEYLEEIEISNQTTSTYSNYHRKVRFQ